MKDTEKYNLYYEDKIRDNHVLLFVESVLKTKFLAASIWWGLASSLQQNNQI